MKYGLKKPGWARGYKPTITPKLQLLKDLSTCGLRGAGLIIYSSVNKNACFYRSRKFVDIRPGQGNPKKTDMARSKGEYFINPSLKY